MRLRHRFRPEFVEALEERKVLSHVGKTISTTTAAINGPSGKVVKNQAPSIATLVNVSFASFVSDYNAARSVYFASIQARTAPIGDSTSTNPATGDPAGDVAAIQQFTSQRVELLAQQLRNDFQQSSLYSSKGHNPDPLPVITKKIDAPATTPTAKMPYNTGTLGRALYLATPSPTASPTAVALNALAQDNAIEAARVGIINGINSLKVQASKNH